MFKDFICCLMLDYSLESVWCWQLVFDIENCSSGVCKLSSDAPEFTIVLSIEHLQSCFVFPWDQSCYSDAVWILCEIPQLVKLDDDTPKASLKYVVISVLCFKARRIRRISPENTVSPEMKV